MDINVLADIMPIPVILGLLAALALLFTYLLMVAGIELLRITIALTCMALHQVYRSWCSWKSNAFDADARSHRRRIGFVVYAALSVVVLLGKHWYVTGACSTFIAVIIALAMPPYLGEEDDFASSTTNLGPTKMKEDR